MNLIREDEGKTFTFQHFGENRLEGEAVSFIVIHNLDFRNLHNLHFKISEKLCLQWNDFQDNIKSTFNNLREEKTSCTIFLGHLGIDRHRTPNIREIIWLGNQLLLKGSINWKTKSIFKEHFQNAICMQYFKHSYLTWTSSPVGRSKMCKSNHWQAGKLAMLTKRRWQLDRMTWMA